MSSRAKQSGGRVRRRSVEQKRNEAAPAAGPAFHVVGLGASAGGLQALEEFFASVPADTGMAFVVVTHLHPGQPSLMHELVGRKTAMPVTELKTSTAVEPNHVYTVRPGWNVAIVNGTLHPTIPEHGGAATVPLPIDHFFRSLAQDQKERAVGVVLSGTGSDGTIGIKEIKGALGIVMVQDEPSAAYFGMPASAIATGLVDCVLPPSEMPARLLEYVNAGSAARRAFPARGGRQRDAEALQQILGLLRARTCHDFSGYRARTINSRIARRMSIHHLDNFKRYLVLLQSRPEELELLFKDLLIGVTSFFRDPQAFDALEEALGALVATKPSDYQLRVWVPGCASGEEAYSVAILLREIAARANKRLAFQIFGTDLDEKAVQIARAGLYPRGVARDIRPDRLERFFTREDDSFRVTKELREMVVFAPQNLLADPPFTRLDVLCCRNLLIYLEAELQHRLVPLFHHALRPDGILFLGPSETVAGFGHLFGTVNAAWRIFQRREVPRGTYVPEWPSGRAPASPWSSRAGSLFGGAQTGLAQRADRLVVRELVPPTVLVRQQGDIVHVHGRTGMFLELEPGTEAAANVFTMSRGGLRPELAALVRRAAAADGEVVHRDVPFKPDGRNMRVDLRARRVDQPVALRGMVMISFEGARSAPPASATPRRRAGPTSRGRLTPQERHLPLTSTNEELQQANEELQRTNQELETTKEELQSLNEELQTLNTELRGKVDELVRTRDDMKNFLDTTEVAAVYLDRSLNIARFTDGAKPIMHLVPADVGRPFADVAPRLRYDGLAADARRVLATLGDAEREVEGDDGNWYLVRVRPYRTAENDVDGLTMTCAQITSAKRSRESERGMLRALGGSHTTLFGQDRDLRYTWISGGAFRGAPQPVVGSTDESLFDPEGARRLGEVKRRVLESGVGASGLVAATIDGQPRTYDLRVEAVEDDSGEIVGITGVQTDVTALAGHKGGES